MAIIGYTDAFERKYTEKFRVIAAEFGEFVGYDRDRGVRDIGIHLIHRLRSGKERVSGAFCWFQLKGITSKRLSRDTFSKSSHVSVRLAVGHLRYWFLQPIATHLAVYIESTDIFLVLNLQQYVTDRWGKDILTLNQKTATVRVSTGSTLDHQAFNLILIQGDLSEWGKVLECEEDSLRLCRRDFRLIWRLGTAGVRKVEHRVVFRDWQSKLRSEIYFQEREVESEEEWLEVRGHLEYRMHILELETAYPYLEFMPLDDCSENGWWEDHEGDFEYPNFEMSNGQKIYGDDAAGEYFEYRIAVMLNSLGHELFESVRLLTSLGLGEERLDEPEFISVAPWHGRHV